MKVINDVVGKNLKIYQDNDYFKFSLESVLLPNFVKINLKDKLIMDLCTGNAPIPLILSTKTKALIYGVELQKEVYNLAINSIILNNKQDQIKIINEDVKNLKNIFKGDKFDIITVNPPYFKIGDNSSINLNKIKANARHEKNLTLEELIKIVKYLLKNNGSFYMVHRTERFIEIIELLKQNNLMPKEIQFIHSDINKKSKLFMIKAVKNGKIGLEIKNPLYIYDENGEYKEEIKKIFE